MCYRIFQGLVLTKAENKKFSDEIKDTVELIKDGGKKIHEIEKQRKELEKENRYLSDGLEDAERALTHEKNKHKELQLEINKVHEEHNNIIAEMEKTFEITKANHKDIIQLLKQKMEGESKEKSKVFRENQKMELKKLELDESIEKEETIHNELLKKAKTVLGATDIFNDKLLVEQTKKEEAMQNLADAENRLKMTTNALEEIKWMLEHVDRARREIEQDAMNANDLLCDLSSFNCSLMQEKQNLSADVKNLNVSS